MALSKTVFAAIVGRPNVGKSTLLNTLVGAKIAITSRKPQTTRNRIMGVLTEDGAQYVFLDTPGFHVPDTKLGGYMVQAARGAVEDADAVLFVTYPKEEFDELELRLLSQIKECEVPVILVMNKSDILTDAEKTGRLLSVLSGAEGFSDSAAVSALTGHGIENLKEILLKYAEEGDMLFDEDTLTDIPEKGIASEFLRESLLNCLFDELPYGTAVYADEFKRKPGGERIDIQMTILCEKSRHKGMIIGKGGVMLKKISADARKKIEDFFGERVNLKCWVKVKEDWRNDEYTLRDIDMTRWG